MERSVDEAAFAEIEEGILRGLREVRERKRGASVPRPSAGEGRFVVESVDADLRRREDVED